MIILKNYPLLVLRLSFRRNASFLCTAFAKGCHRTNHVKSVSSFLPLDRMRLTSSSSQNPIFTRICIKLLHNGTVSSESWMQSIEEDMTDAKYQGIAERYFFIPVFGHQVFVIQPYVKWGRQKKTDISPELQLQEATTLVKTLPKWKVVDKLVVPLKSLEKRTLFGSGNLETLGVRVERDVRITAVFISVNLLTFQQHMVLQELFKVPVFDRYRIVIEVFREHAVTQEAKLQVAMAEIPYLRSRMKLAQEGQTERPHGGIGSMGGAGESLPHIQDQIIREREQKLKQALKKLRSRRELLRSNRKKHEFPSVAVVGYTNAGKTSLIKALTGDKNLEPRNELFATLDVTNHSGMLPSKMEVLYVDTVGFISDIPTSLIESFVATLEDAMLADVIVHVCDVSHPACISQYHTVLQTLESLNIDKKLLQQIVTIGNKVDLVTDIPVNLPTNMIFTSTVQLTGVDVLRLRLDHAVISATGRSPLVIRVPMGGPESAWLYKETTVQEADADPKDSQYLLMRVVITKAMLGRFRHMYPNSIEIL